MARKVATLERIPVDQVHIEGMLELPANVQSIVLFAHGSGSISCLSSSDKGLAGVGWASFTSQRFLHPLGVCPRGLVGTAFGLCPPYACSFGSGLSDLGR